MKQQQLTFDKGITNVPSDAICSDNALSESIGLVYENQEHRVIQHPQQLMAGMSGRLIYVHKYNDTQRFITIDTEGNVNWGTNNDGTYKESGTLLQSSGTVNATSVGKTLILTDDNGIHYFLWKENEYKIMSSGLEDPKVEVVMAGSYSINTTEDCSNCIHTEGNLNLPRISEGKQDEYDTLVLGLYAKNKKKQEELNRFVNPFFARYAIELYDGTYTYISNPILLMPSIHANSYGAYYNSKKLEMGTYGSSMRVKCSFDYSEWTDLVKDVVLLASDGVDVYDLEMTDQQFKNETSITDGIYRTYSSQDGNASREILPTYHSYATHGTVLADKSVTCLVSRSEEDLKNRLEEVSVFYRLCSLGIKRNDEDFVAAPIKPHVVENLTTQDQLDTDDYYSRSPLFPKFTYVYNSRLNIASVKRGFFSGFSFFMPYAASANAKSDTYIAYVKITTDSGDTVVRHEYQSPYIQGLWFYYPDSRASWVTIYKHTGNINQLILNAELKEHTGLNGAYYFHKIPTGENDQPVATSSEGALGEKEVKIVPELLPNYIISSEVNNPFVFPASGYNKVGTGRIIAMSTMTQALSQGQFGQYPLIVFTTEGIWAVSVNATGLLQSVHPMSREVALEDNPCITQTDGAVFFASEKGLMVISGSQVACVSSQLSGRDDTFQGVAQMGNFTDYLRSAFIAYDYRDSLLWIFNRESPLSPSNPSTPSEEITPIYIYSIKTGTFSRYNLGESIVTTAVNNYPDYLLQSGGTIFSLIARPNINADNNRYAATIITRPMKLENGLALKTIMQARHIHDMHGTLKLRIFISNNLRHWAEIHSLQGEPWKYYRFRYDFTNLLATDRFSGTVIVTEEQRTNKLR